MLIATTMRYQYGAAIDGVVKKSGVEFLRVPWSSRRVTSAVLCFLIAAFLASCFVGPKYTRPTVPLPLRWRVPTDTNTTLADVAWWRLFQDTVLQELIRTSLNENKDLRLAIARVRESRAQYVITRAAQYPKLDALGAYVSARLPNLPGGRDTLQSGMSAVMNFFSSALDLSYELDVWGRLRQTTRAARFEVRASASERQTVLTTLISDVAQAYFDLLELDQVAIVSRRTVNSRRASLELVRDRFEGGITSELDVRRAEQELAAAAATIPDVERRIAQTEDRLSILLGRNPGPIPRGVSLDAQVMPPEVPAGLPSKLIERRPDIREAEQRLVAANARIRAALAEFFPKISLLAIYGGQNSDLSRIFDNESRTWLIIPMVRVPISQGGAIRGNVELTRAHEQQALIMYEQTVQQAFREVNDALVFQRTAREIRVQRQIEVTAAQRALELANLRYIEGLGNYLDVLDAERQLFAAELDLASVIADQLRAVAQLYKALGGGWNVELYPRDP